MEIAKDIFQYIVNHSDKEDEILTDLSRRTNLTTIHPRMLSGHLQGKLLEFISKMIKPERILEIGTFTGYSAICLAKGLSENGLLFTIEINDERKKIIEEFIDKAEFSDKIKLLIGDAIKQIPKITEVFDLVFIDADKPNYLNYYKAVLPKLKSGGFILVDNVLWDGKVVHKVSKDDMSTKGIFDFNNYVQNDTTVENLMLPLRDGLMLIRKKE
ncbi:MAG: O-methyltransferase [Bacteroidales bacterium]|nr:O-methyltransferase [Bacteroidales bacterium]